MPRLTLHASAYWGDSLVATRDVGHGQALGLNVEGAACRLPGPEGLQGIVAKPIRGGWILEAPFATDGFVEKNGERLPLSSPLSEGAVAVIECGEGFGLVLQVRGRGTRPRAQGASALIFLAAVAFAATATAGSLFVVRELSPSSKGGAPSTPDGELARLYRTVAVAPAPVSAEAPSPRPSGPDETLEPLQALSLAMGTSTATTTAQNMETSGDAQLQAPIAVWDRAASTARVFGQGNGLNEAQIKRVLSARMDALQACLAVAGAKGQLVVKLQVAPDGSIDSAALTHTSLQDPGTERCVLRELWRLALPAAPRPTTAHVVLAVRARGVR
jgi:hypothetical protein